MKKNIFKSIFITFLITSILSCIMPYALCATDKSTDDKSLQNKKIEIVLNDVKYVANDPRSGMVAAYDYNSNQSLWAVSLFEIKGRDQGFQTITKIWSDDNENVKAISSLGDEFEINTIRGDADISYRYNYKEDKLIKEAIFINPNMKAVNKCGEFILDASGNLSIDQAGDVSIDEKSDGHYDGKVSDDKLCVFPLWAKILIVVILVFAIIVVLLFIKKRK